MGKTHPPPKKKKKNDRKIESKTDRYTDVRKRKIENTSDRLRERNEIKHITIK
jgi:hypothetical protein